MPGATYFFTVNLANRQDNNLLTKHVDALRAAIRATKKNASLFDRSDRNTARSFALHLAFTTQ
jgi:hypothetical protein